MGRSSWQGEPRKRSASTNSLLLLPPFPSLPPPRSSFPFTTCLSTHLQPLHNLRTFPRSADSIVPNVHAPFRGSYSESTSLLGPRGANNRTVQRWEGDGSGKLERLGRILVEEGEFGRGRDGEEDHGERRRREEDGEGRREGGNRRVDRSKQRSRAPSESQPVRFLFV